MLKVIDDFPSNSQADQYAAIIGAYDPITGKIAVGKSVPKGNSISRSDLHPDTVKLIEDRLGVKVGEKTTFCSNTAGVCAEVSAADALIRQGVKPDHIQFTKAYRPRIVRTKGVDADGAIIATCPNCSITFPTKK
ncbi:hypothetical protein [Moraxella atlantae]|uniref:hypothetical protein n=1 Tax=Faucicola atlantae TaxID=34059 RepID=UPI001582038E|nr:hypothetical protein [Moraxella atlantae]